MMLKFNNENGDDSIVATYFDDHNCSDSADVNPCMCTHSPCDEPLAFLPEEDIREITAILDYDENDDSSITTFCNDFDCSIDDLECDELLNGFEN